MQFFVKFFLPLLACATAQAATLHVINGTEAVPHTHPWMVRIGSCGGSLIRDPCLSEASAMVLTAAHCVDSININQEALGMSVKAGKHNLTNDQEIGQQERKVAEVWLHHGKSSSYYANDLALVKLNESIPFSTTIQPIDLPNSGASLGSESNCFFAGWGQTETEDYSDVLLELKVNPDSSYCNRDSGYNNTVMICAERRYPIAMSSGGGVACDQDSGSPMVCKDGDKLVQHGIVSGLPASDDGIRVCKTPVVFVRVSYYVEWIQERMKYNRLCEPQEK